MRRLTLILTAVVLFGATSGAAPAVVPPPDPPVGGDPTVHARIDTDTLVSPDASGTARKANGPQDLAKTSQPSTAQTADSGFSWGDAGIGAAGMLGLIAVVGGALIFAAQHRRERRHPIATS